jgi:hypothetical protein
MVNHLLIAPLLFSSQRYENGRMERAVAMPDTFANTGRTLPPLSWRAVIVLALLPTYGAGATGSATQTLSAQIDAIGKLSVPATSILTSAGTTFAGYSGSLTISYRARTTSATGSGSLTVQATADFSPAGGPSIASGQLTYTCGGATLGTGCSGTQMASTTSQTNVATIGASACTGGGGSCSTVNPNTVQASLSLANNPTNKTGTYSATLTFTISAI